MMAPLAVLRAVEDACGLRADVKWPNDIQIGGKKLAGILDETDVAEGADPVVLVGTGINVNFNLLARGDQRYRHEPQKLGREVDREHVLAAYARRFEELYYAAVRANRPSRHGRRAS